MQTQQRLALLIYLIMVIPLLWLVHAVVAPFAARIGGFDVQAARWGLLSLTGIACLITAIRISRHKAPLKFLNRAICQRRNSGSTKFLSELSTRTYDTTDRDSKK
jgi:hypothetical protein